MAGSRLHERHLNLCTWFKLIAYFKLFRVTNYVILILERNFYAFYWWNEEKRQLTIILLVKRKTCVLSWCEKTTYTLVLWMNVNDVALDFFTYCLFYVEGTIYTLCHM